MAGKHDRTQTVARLSEPMRRGLVYIAARPDGRMLDLDSTVRWNTVASLIDRGLLEIIVANGTCKFYKITPAGRAAAGVDEPITDGLFAQADEVTPEPAPTQDTLTADQAAGMARTRCSVDFRQVAVPSVPAGYGPHGQVFRCLGCSDASDAQDDEVVPATPDPTMPRAHGEGAVLVDWPDDTSGDLLEMAIGDILSGYVPASCEPLRTATVPRASGGDGAYAPTAHPADPDGGSPFWRACKTITLPPLR